VLNNLKDFYKLDILKPVAEAIRDTSVSFVRKNGEEKLRHISVSDFKLYVNLHEQVLGVIVR
jgi:hypothetical protein